MRRQAPTVKPTEPGKKTTIRIGSPFKAGHILVDAAEKFKELIEKGSGGRIAVEMQVGMKSEEEINDLMYKGDDRNAVQRKPTTRNLRTSIFFLGRPLRHEGLGPSNEGLAREPRKEGESRRWRRMET